jgi:hypothetical protein
MSQVKNPALLHEGPWIGLLQQAFRLIDDFQAKGGLSDPFWTFGGGTVLMLRYHHRKSKDIDIFVPDPQYLGYVTPRLSDLAMEVASDYVEAAGYVKLMSLLPISHNSHSSGGTCLGGIFVWRPRQKLWRRSYGIEATSSPHGTYSISH